MVVAMPCWSAPASIKPAKLRDVQPGRFCWQVRHRHQLPTQCQRDQGRGDGRGLTEKLAKYNIYRKMLADYFEQPEDEAAKRVEEFEKLVKQRFIKEPGQMRLLIVVDKLLTGFDAPLPPTSISTRRWLITTCSRPSAG